MKCAKCGAGVPKNARFCSKCGTQVASETNLPSPKPQTATSPPKKSKKGWIIALIIGLVVLVLLIGAGIGLYFYAKSKIEKTLKDQLNQLQTQPSVTNQVISPTQQPPITPPTIPPITPPITPPQTQEGSPSDVVMDYMQKTLGSLPNNVLDYTTAKTYLAPHLESQFDEPSFIPMSYCIQDGPDDVKTYSEETTGDQAEVIVSVLYGPEWVDEFWKFTLVKTSSGWKISEIECLAVS